MTEGMFIGRVDERKYSIGASTYQIADRGIVRQGKLDLIFHVEKSREEEQELFRQVRIESQAGPPIEDLDGCFKGLSVSVRTRRSQFIKRIGNAQDSGPQGD